MPHPGWITTLVFIVDLLIRLGFSVRVIMRRLPVGTSLAWLTVILIFPFGGTLVYLYLGEYRLGHRRTRRIAAVQEQWHELVARTFPLGDALTSGPALVDSRLPHLAETKFLAALLPGNRLDLLEDAAAAFTAMIADIERAQESCDFEFYIWF
ncbi:MAG TPA: hypothetical protein VHY20_15980, partial [Pirellulales bacterium]|nr:hypothetical protein [Pirellulales bacterium]